MAYREIEEEGQISEAGLEVLRVLGLRPLRPWHEDDVARAVRRHVAIVHATLTTLAETGEVRWTPIGWRLPGGEE